MSLCKPGFNRAMAWAVAVTWPLHERRVERALKREGFDVYLPRWKTPRRRTALLFPRYVFTGPPDAWRELREIYGVSRLLKRTGEWYPAEIPDEHVQAIKAREDKNGFVKLPEKPKFKIGQRVRITLGAFTGQVGVYAGAAKRGRERVTLSAFEIALPAGSLMAE